MFDVLVVPQSRTRRQGREHGTACTGFSCNRADALGLRSWHLPLPLCCLSPPPISLHPPLLPPTPPPPLLQAAQEEQRRVMREHGDKLDMDVLNSMDTLHLNIQVRAGWSACTVAMRLTATSARRCTGNA